MKLLTAALRKQLPPIYSQEHIADPLVLVKFFTPWAKWTWYALEFDGEDQFFGLIDGAEAELGYFALSELSGIKGPLGLHVERDRFWKPTPLSQVRLNGIFHRFGKEEYHGL